MTSNFFSFLISYIFNLSVCSPAVFCGFQTPASLAMEGIIRFHDDLMIILFFILGMVLYMLFAAIYV